MVEKDKKKVTGYIISDGEIGFLNYRNKVFKSVQIRNVVDKYFEQVEEMAVEKIA